MNTYDKERPCPKCVSMDINDHYVSPTEIIAAGLEFSSLGSEISNTIRRTCNNCKYMWYETPLDSLPTPTTN